MMPMMLLLFAATMEQIFMIEVFVKKIILKVEPYVKDEYEIKQEEEETKRREEAAAAAEAALLLKLKGKKAKPKKPKKPPKKKKEPPGPSEEELKYMQTCTVQMSCQPIFDFYVAHDNFVPPPPPEPVGKKPKKKKKAKKGKKGKVIPFKVSLPSEPLPQPPYFGVGNTVVFLSRPSKLREMLKTTPIYITVWNREQEFNCIGFTVLDWHESFIDCLTKSGDLNPVNMEQGEFRVTTTQELMTNTVAVVRPLQCEEDLKWSGEVEIFIRLSCLGNRMLTNYVSLPEMDRLPGRKYLIDDYKLKDLEVVRHWEGSLIAGIPPVAWFFGGPDICRDPIIPVPPPEKYDVYVAPYTNSELAIMAMGFPKGPCGGTNCPKRMDYRGSQHQFIHGEMVKGKYQHGQFVNKRDVHGPCGRLDCPLAKKVRNYICSEGAYKPCKKPCCKDYY